jgi:hypothetical protein
LGNKYILNEKLYKKFFKYFTLIYTLIFEFQENSSLGIFLASWNFPGILASWKKIYELLIKENMIN